MLVEGRNGVGGVGGILGERWAAPVCCHPGNLGGREATKGKNPGDLQHSGLSVLSLESDIRSRIIEYQTWKS